jgi:hypothetical protein
VRSTSTPSLSTSPAIDASLRSQSRGGRNHRRVGGWESGAPPTASGGGGGSAWQGVALCDSEAPFRLGVTRGGPSTGPHRQGELLAVSLSPHSCRARDEDTSVTRGGDDEDDPDISLQSTAALGASPLHDSSCDRSSSEETPRSPAFRLLMRLSFRSLLAIWHSLYCALRAARRLSAVALFRLKIASSRRGALAGTRWVHFNCNDKKAERSARVKGLCEDQRHKNTREASRSW